MSGVNASSADTAEVLPEWNDLPDECREALRKAAGWFTEDWEAGQCALDMYYELRKTFPKQVFPLFQQSGDVAARPRKTGAPATLLSLLNVMESAFAKGEGRLMSVWERDIEAVKQAIAAMEGDAPAQAAPEPDLVDILGWLLNAIKSEVSNPTPLLKRRFSDSEKALLAADHPTQGGDKGDAVGNKCLRFIKECEDAGSIEHAVAFELVNILTTPQPASIAYAPIGTSPVAVELMQRIWDNLYHDRDEFGTYQQTLNEVVDWLAALDAIPSVEASPLPSTDLEGK